MNVEAILAAFRAAGLQVPEAALLAAMDQPAEVTPMLLELVQAALDDPDAFLDCAAYTEATFALFLLAQFRELRARPLVLAMLRQPEERIDSLLGDLLTEGMPSVLASLFHDDPATLAALAAEAGVDAYARAAAMDALLVLGFSGVLSEEQLAIHFEGLLDAFEARGGGEDPTAWSWLLSACVTAGFKELLPRLRQACEDGRVDAEITEETDLEVDPTLHLAHRRRRFLKTHHLVEDAVLDLEDLPWMNLEEEDLDPDAFDEDEGEDLDFDPDTIATLAPGAVSALMARQRHPAGAPARNAPCPCGSGKKYKRCCGKD